MTSSIATPRSVATSVEEVGKWRSAEESRLRTEVEAVDREIAGIQAAVANLTERLTMHEGLRKELEGQAATASDSVIARSYQAVFGALAEQAGALSDRAGVVAAAEFARNSNLEESLRASAGGLFDEYRQFKTTVEPTLAALPESYRKVLMAHHDELAGKVRAVVEAAVASAEPLQVAPIDLDVVWGIDAPEGTPDLLVVVVPADEGVATAWADRGDDAELWLAARVVQGVTEALLASGLAGVRPALGGHLGLLAIEVDLTGAMLDFGQVLQSTLSRVLSEASELGDARLRVVPRQVEMDWLLPPETTVRGDA